jgi:hypothetical protein
VKVYDPGKKGKGPYTTQTGPNGQPGKGSILPYKQILADYKQAARAALDQGQLSPSLQSYVRAYFASISK